MRIASLDRVQIHWREDGDPLGRAIVFANSLGTDLRLWDKVLPLLPQELRVIRFDKRGHGLSSCPTGPYSMDELTNDTAKLLDSIGVSDCVFVGLSIGGMIAQDLAAKRPDLVQAMVLSNTGAKMGEVSMWRNRIGTIESHGIEGAADAILERWFSEHFRRSDELTAWRHMLSRTPKAGYIACCQAISGADLTNSTRQLRIPTLGIAGALDGASPPELVKNTTALISGSQFQLIPDVGHLPCVEAPDKYAELLGNFLREVGHVGKS